jgi:hypothetical protein
VPIRKNKRAVSISRSWAIAANLARWGRPPGCQRSYDIIRVICPATQSLGWLSAAGGRWTKSPANPHLVPRLDESRRPRASVSKAGRPATITSTRDKNRSVKGSNDHTPFRTSSRKSPRICPACAWLKRDSRMCGWNTQARFRDVSRVEAQSQERSSSRNRLSFPLGIFEMSFSLFGSLPVDGSRSNGLSWATGTPSFSIT